MMSVALPNKDIAADDLHHCETPKWRIVWILPVSIGGLHFHSSQQATCCYRDVSKFYRFALAGFVDVVGGGVLGEHVLNELADEPVLARTVSEWRKVHEVSDPSRSDDPRPPGPNRRVSERGGA